MPQLTSTTELAQLPCTTLKGVGEKLAERLANCGIKTVQDLLFHLPFRYQDRTRITPMGYLKPGDHAVIEGVIEAVTVKKGRKLSLLCYLRDSAGILALRFFHFTAAQQAQLTVGTRLRCFGEVRYFANELEMIHPEYHVVRPNTLIPVEEHLTPIYPATEGLAQRMLRQLTQQTLTLLERGLALQDYLPKEILATFHLLDLIAALHYVHRPPPDAPVNLLMDGTHPAQQRLAFEELLAHHLSLRRLRQETQCYRAPVLSSVDTLTQRFLNQLPFSLTKAQAHVVQEVFADIATPKPMMRLIQGDVGSGKTIVAALAVLQAVANQYQAALMVPTELLAEQHYQNLSQWFTSLGIQVAFLSGKMKTNLRQQVLVAIAKGEAQVVIGTHALFQDDVVFAQLGLMIVDEQHRFGVQQRLALREKAAQNDRVPHQLIMSATPIPRTLAMTIYADLDVSIIDELPPGRTPVITVVAQNHRRDEVITRIRHACQEKRQVYWVCTLIEESEQLQCQAAQATAEQLTKELPKIKIALIHGRMKSQERDPIMLAFKAREIDLLVATTVIEVGVDIPNASLMIIENAERLGLAQLHQLRGRIGRGTMASYCVLLYQTPLSNHAKARLAVMRETCDGFEIARRDLELRGPGEVLGTRQTGMLQLRIADMLRDQKLLPDVQRAAELLLHAYPQQVAALIQRWLGDNEQYGQV